VSLELKDSETVVSQEMVRHGTVDETCQDDAAVAAAATVETEGMDETAESRDGWLTGWKLPVLSDVVNKTSSVVQQTVQQTSNVVCCCFCCYATEVYLLCRACLSPPFPPIDDI